MKKLKNALEEATNDDEITITRYPEAHEPVRKRRAMVFSDVGKKLLEGNEMLADESINLAMNISHIIGGLTDSSKSKCQQFDIVPRENNYIQILHAGSIPWICVANMTSGLFGQPVDNGVDFLP